MMTGLTPPPSPQIITSTFSGTISSNSFDGKRHPRLKEGQFIYKHGQKHHSYDNEKAPYPLSYDRCVLEIESMDNRLARHLRGSISFVNLEEIPKRTLDLGCGTGTWVVDAAEEWPECEFVGFDLVNIQIPLTLLEPSIASRIEWEHGNFLTTKLPFDDDDFDHVHIQSIAKGVPENKWGTLFEEINRVLRPGGSVEIIEDDVVFPTLPRWFTGALRPRPRRESSVHLPDGSSRGYPSPPSTPSKSMLSHDHALLESLNASVFEHRFINMKPTAVLPSYFTTYFRQVTLGPVINFPTPPFAPFQPLHAPTPTMSNKDSGSGSRSPTKFTLSKSQSTGRSASLSFSSHVSTSTDATEESRTTLYDSHQRVLSSSVASTIDSSDSPTLISGSVENFSVIPEKLVPLPMMRFMLDGSLSESEIAALPRSLFPLEQLTALNERSLAMHLYRSFQTVLACQEAMWEELKDRIRNRKEELVRFGWEDDEELEELQSRKKFELLIERYKMDMQARIALWCSLTNIGWPVPIREPLTKAELVEEERLRESMLEARKFATWEELQVPCRALRVLVGYKL